jgi:RNA polymerase sigma-70 factor (ECF subfamily)
MDSIDSAMQRYVDGDAMAFAEIYDALAPRLLSRLIHLTASREQASDLLQETFLRIHARRATFRPGERVTLWAFAIARNVFIDDRRRRRARPFDAPSAAIDPAECAGGTDPERVAVARQQTARIQRLLGELTVLQREAILRAVLDPQGGSNRAMKLRRFRARRVLASALA